MVAGDEGQVVELLIGGEAVAPALVFRRDDEGPRRKPLTAAHLDADAGHQAHGLHHALYIAADTPAGRASSGGEGREGRRRGIGDRQNPVGGIESETAHPATMARIGGRERPQAALGNRSAQDTRLRPPRLEA